MKSAVETLIAKGVNIEELRHPKLPTDDSFWGILEQLYENTGYDFRGYRTLQRRISRRLYKLSLKSYQAYQNLAGKEE